MSVNGLAEAAEALTVEGGVVPGGETGGGLFDTSGPASTSKLTLAQPPEPVQRNPFP